MKKQHQLPQLRPKRDRRRGLSRISKFLEHLNTKKPGFTVSALPSIKPFMRHPEKGVRYLKGEMKFSLIMTFLLQFYLGFLLLNFRAYIFQSIISTLLLVLLTLFNLFNALPKILIFHSLIKIREASDLGGDVKSKRRYFRAEIIKIFGKRIYHLSIAISAFFIFAQIFVLKLVILKIFIFEKKIKNIVFERKVEFEIILFVFVYFLRVFYSINRYKRYFKNLSTKENLFGLEETEVENTGVECPICRIEFEIKKEKIAILNCKCKFQYHFECINEWIQKKNKCCFCTEKIIDEDSFED